MMRTSTCSLWGLALALGAFGLSGCGSTGPKAYNVVVSLAEDAFPPGKIPTIEVDIVPLTAEEKKKWSEFILEEYLDPNTYAGRLRERYLKNNWLKRLVFNEESTKPQNLGTGESIWKERIQAGASEMLVAASLRIDSKGNPIEKDPRCMFLPLDSSCWEQEQIQVQVDNLEIKLLTPKKEKK